MIKAPTTRAQLSRLLALSIFLSSLSPAGALAAGNVEVKPIELAPAAIAPGLAAPGLNAPALNVSALKDTPSLRSGAIIAAQHVSAAAIPTAAAASGATASAVPALAATPVAAASARAAARAAAAAEERRTTIQVLESAAHDSQDHRAAADSGSKRFDGAKSFSGSGSGATGGNGGAGNGGSSSDNGGRALPASAPILTLSGVVFPGKILSLGLQNEEGRKILLAAQKSGGYMVAAYSPEAGGDARGNSPTASIVKVSNIEMDGEKTTATMEVLRTVTIEGYEKSGGVLVAKVSYPAIPSVDQDKLSKLAGIAKASFAQFAHLDEEIKTSFARIVMGTENASQVASTIAQGFPFSEETKLKLLKLPAGEARLQGVILEMMAHFKKLSASAVEEEDEAVDPLSSPEAFKAKLDSIGMPADVQKTALKEYANYKQLNPKDSEASKLRTYLGWLTDVPWSARTEDKFDAKAARELLDRDHFGLESVKNRVLEFLAVRKKTGAKKGTILLFSGPPGVGKTSIAGSIAAALGRKFVRLSLGGVHDESVLRGHGRTYVGSLPGQIMRQMKQAGTVNPVFLLDEIDKMGRNSAQGDPTAAMLEILDPNQNGSFRDQYLDVPYDLSEVVFIVTANDLSTIPEPLRDRMEIIEFDGYTPLEKVGIVERHLIPNALKKNGLTPEEAGLSKDAIRKVIEGYTMESGVRSLGQKIDSIFRKVAAWIETRGEKVPGQIAPDQVEHYLGVERFRHRDTTENDVGLATGLAVNDYGGSTMNVVVRAIPGSGRVHGRTQQLEMIRDSAENAFTYVRTNAAKFGLSHIDFSKIDLDIAFTPAGKIDGPSAGGLMTTAIISELSGRKVAPGLAMTGEVTPDGRILPIGGLKQKVMAAHRMGYKMVIFPAANEKDVESIPEEVRKGIVLKAVKRYDEIFPLALTEQVPGKGAAFAAFAAPGTAEKSAAAPVPAPAAGIVLAVRGPITVTLQPSGDAADPQVVMTGPQGVIDSYRLHEAAQVLRQASFRWWNPATWFAAKATGQEAAVEYASLLASRLRRR